MTLDRRLKRCGTLWETEFSTRVVRIGRFLLSFGSSKIEFCGTLFRTCNTYYIYYVTHGSGSEAPTVLTTVNENDATVKNHGGGPEREQKQHTTK